MTTIDFYFNAPDRLQIACRLAGRAVAERKRLLVYAPDPDVATKLDRLMWTWPAIAFVPHCPVEDPLAPDTPVLIARGEETPAGCALLLNLSSQTPPHFARFERLFEIVDEAEREPARERYRVYRARGYAISSHDLAREDG